MRGVYTIVTMVSVFVLLTVIGALFTPAKDDNIVGAGIIIIAVIAGLLVWRKTAPLDG